LRWVSAHLEDDWYFGGRRFCRERCRSASGRNNHVHRTHVRHPAHTIVTIYLGSGKGLSAESSQEAVALQDFDTANVRSGHRLLPPRRQLLANTAIAAGLGSRYLFQRLSCWVVRRRRRWLHAMGGASNANGGERF